MAQRECTSSLNFEHLEYKFQVPADSLIQYTSTVLQLHTKKVAQKTFTVRYILC